MYVIKKLCVFLYKLRERNSSVNHKSKHCVHQQSFAASNGENVVLSPNKILLKAHFLRYQPQIWNTICLDLWLWFSSRFRVQHFSYINIHKIKYKILFVNNFHKLKPL